MNFRFPKSVGISRLAEKLSTDQEGSCCIEMLELVNLPVTLLELVSCRQRIVERVK